MEIKFRPMPASTLARRVSPGQSPTEDGQSFVEVVDSLTAADQTPEKNSDAGDNRRQPPQNRPHAATHEQAEDAMEMPTDQTLESAGDNPNAQPADKTDPKDKSLGTRLDLTA